MVSIPHLGRSLCGEGSWTLLSVLGAHLAFETLGGVAPTCLPPCRGPSESLPPHCIYSDFRCKVEGLEQVKKPEEAQASVSCWTLLNPWQVAESVVFIGSERLRPCQGRGAGEH